MPVCLLALGAWFLPAVSSAQDTSQELVRRAQAMRREPSPANYQALERFAAEYAESELSAQASFALGVADFEAERWLAARDRFTAARRSRLLGDYAALFLARVEMQQGALEAARESLQELLSPNHPLSEAARVAEADRRVRAGQAKAAADWLRRLPDLDERPGLLFALALAERGAGNPLAAADALQRIYFEFPLSPQAEPANLLLAELRSADLKENYPAPSEELRRTRAERLWNQQAYRGARSAYVDLSVRGSEPTRTEARLRAALALYQLGEATAACEELKSVARAPAKREGEYRAYRVRCSLRASDTAAVESDLAVLAAQSPPSDWYADALLAAGNTALARGEALVARDYYRRLTQAFPAGDAAADAHWKLAWLTYVSKESSATALFEEHLQRFPESSFVPRALYWRARTAMTVGASTVAERLLGLLQDYAPRDYLAQQAERLAARLAGPAGGESWPPAWLEKLAGGLGRPAASPRGEATPAGRALVEKAETLERLGFPELAEEALATSATGAPNLGISLAQARLAHARKNYARATEILRRAFPNYWRYRLDELPREAWEILFPRPYWEVIEREAARQRVDPFLVAALIRQESRFEREAVSSAGALGLMQLMPATAARLAGARRLAPNRIVEPELNIRLGTRFLAELLRRFDGSQEKAVAGYNAGGTRVEGWASQGSYGEPAEFVESIPVTQTREFVYTVLRNYRFYHDLYGTEARAEAEMPELAPAAPPR